MELKDKVAIVAGGGSGIGAVIAELAAREGAIVIVADRNIEDATRRAGALPRAEALRLEVTSQASIAELIAAVEARYGAPDLLSTALRSGTCRTYSRRRLRHSNDYSR